jgi:hypothetical protein
MSGIYTVVIDGEPVESYHDYDEAAEHAHEVAYRYDQDAYVDDRGDVLALREIFARQSADMCPSCQYHQANMLPGPHLGGLWCSEVQS